MIYADLFSRSEIFFFTVLFLVLYICLVPVFCMAQDTWMVVLLNFHLTPSPSMEMVSVSPLDYLWERTHDLWGYTCVTLKSH